MRGFYRLRKDVGDAVLEKYNYTCTSCGSHDDLCVHHIIRMDIHDIRYNDIENLTVLCRKCHMSYHRKNNHIPQPKHRICKKGILRNPYGRRGNEQQIYCKVNGCERLQHAKELCKKHYEYYRRNHIPMV